MKFNVKIPGLTLYNDAYGYQPWEEAVTTADVVAVAQALDELGYDFIQLSTHFVMDREIAKTMGPRWPHSLSTAGFVLGATKRIKVLCLVVVPNHNPVELAKALSTLDWISGGRLIVVPLAGYQEWEFEVLNVPFAERGPRMDEYMEAMLELWTADEPEFEGQFVRFRDIVFDPKPQQRPLTLWFGARTRVALRRLAKHGHGWISTSTAHADFPAELDYVRFQPAFQANPRPLEVYAPIGERNIANYTTHEFVAAPQVFRTRDEILNQLRYLSSLGITVTQAALESGSPEGERATSVADYIRRLEWFATEIMPEGHQI